MKIEYLKKITLLIFFLSSITIHSKNSDPHIKSVSKDLGTDIQITQKIRDKLTANKSISIYAKNISIVTLNGIVTLRGAVETYREKDIIEKYARSVTKPNNIRNQLIISVQGTAR